MDASKLGRTVTLGGRICGTDSEPGLRRNPGRQGPNASTFLPGSLAWLRRSRWHAGFLGVERPERRSHSRPARAINGSDNRRADGLPQGRRALYGGLAGPTCQALREYRGGFKLFETSTRQPSEYQSRAC